MRETRILFFFTISYISSIISNIVYVNCEVACLFSQQFNVFCTHPAVAQVTTLTFTGTTKSDYGGSLSASTGYIKLATPTGINLHWWFDTTGSQTVPSSITLETYKEEIDISGATTAADIAQLVKNAIDNGMPFTNHLNQPDSGYSIT